MFGHADMDPSNIRTPEEQNVELRSEIEMLQTLVREQTALVRHLQLQLMKARGEI